MISSCKSNKLKSPRKSSLNFSFILQKEEEEEASKKIMPSKSYTLDDLKQCPLNCENKSWMNLDQMKCHL